MPKIDPIRLLHIVHLAVGIIKATISPIGNNRKERTTLYGMRNTGFAGRPQCSMVIFSVVRKRRFLC